MNLVLAAILIATSPSAPGERPARQLCGPIAVQMVLHAFGIETPLPSLADEVFQGSHQSTSSLLSLDRTLKAHGIGTLCIDLAPEREIDWPNPVIVHFPASAERPDGHFGVVWPRRAGSDAYLVSLSPGEPMRMPAQRLARSRSRIVLLTSTTPIDKSTVQNLAPQRSMLFVGLLALGTVAAMVAQQRCGFRRRRIA
jgi:hypothetical protein